MNLKRLQQTFMTTITRPLTAADKMRTRANDGRSIKEIADSIIKPSGRQTAFERLELYNTGYWFRILAALAEDFPGLCAVVGRERFDELAAAYLDVCPPGFDLRDLGSGLEGWLRRSPGFAPRRERLALDMVRLEWAEIEASDGVQLPSLAAADLGRLGQSSKLHLQPHVRLLDLAYPVDDLLLRVRGLEKERSGVASNAPPGRATQKVSEHCPMPKRQRVFLAVHRHNDAVYFKRLAPGAFALLVAFQQGRRLSTAIEAALDGSERGVWWMSGQLQHWFAEWSALGWFSRRGGH